MMAWRGRDRSGGEEGRASARRSWVVVSAVAVVLVLFTLPAAGCTVEIGSTREVVVDEPLGAAALTDVEISMGAGSLTVAPGAEGLASGKIVYNIEAWAPKVVRTDDSLSIRQEARKGVAGLPTDIHNEWQLLLGKAPMRLSITAGAYEGSMDLTGLTLQELSIKDGAARNQVKFDVANPGQMSRLVYETGASTVSLTGLANANFKTMSFKGGAGTYTLDFSGQLRTDADVKISAAAGTVRIVVPRTTAAVVTVVGSLNDVKTEGVWTTSGDSYSMSGAGSAGQGRRLTITVDVNLGSVTLVGT